MLMNNDPEEQTLILSLCLEAGDWTANPDLSVKEALSTFRAKYHPDFLHACLKDREKLDMLRASYGLKPSMRMPYDEYFDVLNTTTLYDWMRKVVSHGYMKIDRETFALSYKEQYTNSWHVLELDYYGIHPYDPLWEAFQNSEAELVYDGEWGPWLMERQAHPELYPIGHPSRRGTQSIPEYYAWWSAEMHMAKLLEDIFGDDFFKIVHLQRKLTDRNWALAFGDPWAKDWREA